MVEAIINISTTTVLCSQHIPKKRFPSLREPSFLRCPFYQKSAIPPTAFAVSGPGMQHVSLLGSADPVLAKAVLHAAIEAELPARNYPGEVLQMQQSLTSTPILFKSNN